tara:strand:+ start:159 stop:680 length:522 start_codon:yes stop_codon:yes gene_type:complete
MVRILIKAMRPHRQKILTEQGEEKRLQQWANQKAAEQLRGAGGDASGEQFEQAREALMREAVMNPDKHGIKFMGERVPFEGQELMSDLSTPDVEGEQDAIDSQFAVEDPIAEEFMPGVVVNHGSSFNTPPKKEVEDTKTERQHVPMDQDHPDYFRTSRQTAFRDAWSLLKQTW